MNVGLRPAPYAIRAGSLIGGNKAVAGSQIGGIAETQEMLDFCAEHGIAATIEVDRRRRRRRRLGPGRRRRRALPRVIDTSTLTG